MVEVIRGIVITIYNRDYSKLAIETPLHIYDINSEVASYVLEEGDKLLGVVIDKKFNICTHVTFENNVILFGYINSRRKDGAFSFQTLPKFNKLSYNPYEPKYSLGRRTKVYMSQIRDVYINFNQFRQLCHIHWYKNKN